jgi:hypothetical protein
MLYDTDIDGMNDIENDPDIVAALAKAGMSAHPKKSTPAGLVTWSGLAVMSSIVCVATIVGAFVTDCAETDFTCQIGRITFETGAAIAFLFTGVFSVFAYMSWAKAKQDNFSQ